MSTLTSPQPSLPCETALRTERLAWRFVAVAATLGAIPFPTTSTAIVATNAVMISRMAAAMGVPVSLVTVTESLSLAGIANITGRALFVDAASAIGWVAGPLGLAGVSALGAFTAGLQTWLIGQVVLAICANGGDPLPGGITRRLLARASANFLLKLRHPEKVA